MPSPATPTNRTWLGWPAQAAFCRRIRQKERPSSAVPVAGKDATRESAGLHRRSSTDHRCVSRSRGSWAGLDRWPGALRPSGSFRCHRWGRSPKLTPHGAAVFEAVQTRGLRKPRTRQVLSQRGVEDLRFSGWSATLSTPLQVPVLAGERSQSGSQRCAWCFICTGRRHRCECDLVRGPWMDDDAGDVAAAAHRQSTRIGRLRGPSWLQGRRAVGWWASAARLCDKGSQQRDGPRAR